MISVWVFKAMIDISNNVFLVLNLWKLAQIQTETAPIDDSRKDNVLPTAFTNS